METHAWIRTRVCPYYDGLLSHRGTSEAVAHIAITE